ETVGGASTWRRSLVRQLGYVPLRLDPVIDHVSMSMRDMINLKVGDVIMLNTDLTEEVDIDIDGHTRYAAIAGVVDGKRALRVTRVVREKEE
ncbi:MAG: FliM/FliN family flagellar motor C-terminal domain-containing protein, partial [Magnetococcus sp. DMHC-1]